MLPAHINSLLVPLRLHTSALVRLIQDALLSSRVPPQNLSKSRSEENLAAVAGSAPFPGSPDNLIEQVDYDGSEVDSPSTPGQGEATSETPSQPTPRRAASAPSEPPSHTQEEFHLKGVILVSEAFTEINASLVIVLKSGHPGPVLEAALRNTNPNPDEMATTITQAYHAHVEEYLSTTSPPADVEAAVSRLSPDPPLPHWTVSVVRLMGGWQV